MSSKEKPNHNVDPCEDLSFTSKQPTSNSTVADSEETKIDAFVRREVLLALSLPALLLAAVGVSGAFFREQVTGFATWAYEQLDFGGLALVFFLSETLVSPLPPDAILWIVAGSELSASWYLPVTVLGLLSTLGGHVGWWCGGHLATTGLVRRVLGRHHGRSIEVTRRYGVWAVVLAAVTPLPWSVTSWTAGALHMPWKRYLLGSLTRFPRIVLYYVLIHAGHHGVVTPVS